MDETLIDPLNDVQYNVSTAELRIVSEAVLYRMELCWSWYSCSLKLFYSGRSCAEAGTAVPWSCSIADGAVLKLVQLFPEAVLYRMELCWSWYSCSLKLFYTGWSCAEAGTAVPWSCSIADGAVLKLVQLFPESVGTIAAAGTVVPRLVVLLSCCWF